MVKKLSSKRAAAQGLHVVRPEDANSLFAVALGVPENIGRPSRERLVKALLETARNAVRSGGTTGAKDALASVLRATIELEENTGRAPRLKKYAIELLREAAKKAAMEKEAPLADVAKGAAERLTNLVTSRSTGGKGRTLGAMQTREELLRTVYEMYRRAAPGPEAPAIARARALSNKYLVYQQLQSMRNSIRQLPQSKRAAATAGLEKAMDILKPGFTPEKGDEAFDAMADLLGNRRGGNVEALAKRDANVVRFFDAAQSGGDARAAYESLTAAEKKRAREFMDWMGRHDERVQALKQTILSPATQRPTTPAEGKPAVKAEGGAIMAGDAGKPKKGVAELDAKLKSMTVGEALEYIASGQYRKEFKDLKVKDVAERLGRIRRVLGERLPDEAVRGLDIVANHNQVRTYAKLWRDSLVGRDPEALARPIAERVRESPPPTEGSATKSANRTAPSGSRALVPVQPRGGVSAQEPIYIQLEEPQPNPRASAKTQQAKAGAKAAAGQAASGQAAAGQKTGGQAASGQAAAGQKTGGQAAAGGKRKVRRKIIRRADLEKTIEEAVQRTMEKMAAGQQAAAQVPKRSAMGKLAPYAATAIAAAALTKLLESLGEKKKEAEMPALVPPGQAQPQMPYQPWPTFTMPQQYMPGAPPMFQALPIVGPSPILDMRQYR